jgi:hypothetical protein
LFWGEREGFPEELRHIVEGGRLVGVVVVLVHGELWATLEGG